MTEKPDQRRLPRRFYKTVRLSDELQVLLDDRPAKTPLKSVLRLPTHDLAKVIADEWDSQALVIDPARMPLTKLANTAIDRDTAEHGKMRDEIVAYAASDLVCYRAESPDRLVKRQADAWDPVQNWANDHLHADFVATTGIVHVAQTQSSLHAIANYVGALDAWRLVVLHSLVTLTGSAMLPAMLNERAISAEAAWLAANVDEDDQIEQWGRDDEAMRRRENRHREFEAAVLFLRLLSNA